MGRALFYWIPAGPPPWHPALPPSLARAEGGTRSGVPAGARGPATRSHESSAQPDHRFTLTAAGGASPATDRGGARPGESAHGAAVLVAPPAGWRSAPMLPPPEIELPPHRPLVEPAAAIPPAAGSWAADPHGRGRLPGR